MTVYKLSYRERLKLLAGAAIATFSAQSCAGISISDNSTHDIMTLSLGHHVSYLAWSPDGTKMAVSSREDTLITLWDLVSRQQIWTVEKKLGVTVGGKDLDFGPLGETVITSSAITFGPENTGATISIISSVTGKILQTLSDTKPITGQNKPMNFVLSRDRSRLIASLGDTGRILIYDTGTWRIIDEIGPVINQYGNPGGVKRIAWDEKRGLLALAMRTLHDARVQIWDLSSRKHLKDIRPFKVEVTDVQINPRDGQLVVGGSGDIRGYRRPDAPPLVSTPDTMINVRDDARTLLQAWDIESGQQTRIYYGPGDTVEGVTISPDGKIVAASRGRSLLERTPSYIVIWDFASARELVRIDCGQAFLGDIAFSPDGKKLAYVADSYVHIIEHNKKSAFDLN